MVHDGIALQVAEEERRDYEHVIGGAYGERQQSRAATLGLRGIAYAMAEQGSGRKFRWLVYDLVTGEYMRRHHDADIPGLGFTPYRELRPHAQVEVNQTGLDSDYERTFWKFEALKWVPYEPELLRAP